MTRTKLSDRRMPTYTRGEENFNMISHIVGSAVGVAVLVLSVIMAASHSNAYGVVSSAIYGVTMIMLYTNSSIYHGLKPCMAKRVFQVLDHCSIYILIAGTYTPIALSAIRAVNPTLGWILFAVEWAAAAVGVTLTAIDLNKNKVFAMICYIVMGFAVIPMLPTALQALGRGFVYIAVGGAGYVIGIVFYSVGSKVRYMHNVFHIFCIFGSVVQFFGILFYAL